MAESEHKQNETLIDLHIKDIVPVFYELTSNLNREVALLHVNCEGCEWEMLEKIVQNNLHHHIR